MTWWLNYSRLLKINYKWNSGNIICCLVLRNKFKNINMFTAVSVISKQLQSDDAFISLMSMPSLSLTYQPGNYEDCWAKSWRTYEAQISQCAKTCPKPTKQHWRRSKIQIWGKYHNISISGWHNNSR